MKVFICAVIALCVLTGGIAWFCMEVDKVCTSLLHDAELLETMLLNEEAVPAQRLISDMQKSWEGHTALFMAFSEHKDINSVTDSLADINNRIFFRDFTAAYCTLSDFRHRVSYISDDSKPTLINIF